MKKIVKENLNEDNHFLDKSKIKYGLKSELKRTCKLFVVNLSDEEIYDTLMDLADEYKNELY